MGKIKFFCDCGKEIWQEKEFFDFGMNTDCVEIKNLEEEIVCADCVMKETLERWKLRGHGSPYDRGSADSWYSRGRDPHWYPNGTYNGDRIDPSNGMTDEQIAEYNQGYDDNESDPDARKVW